MKYLYLSGIKKYRKLFFVFGLFMLLLPFAGFSQTELEPWGDIIAIRVDGQPMRFESSLRIAGKDWSDIRATGRERQRPKYKREGNRQIVTTAIGYIHFTETVEDAGSGEAKVSIQVSSDTSENAGPVYFSLALPEEYYANGSMRAGGGNAVPLSGITESGDTQKVSGSVKFISPERQLELRFSEPGDLIVRKENNKGQGHIQVYLPIPVGNLANGQSVTKAFTIIASGKIDKKPVSLILDTANAGRAFAGLGGNFRLQNEKTDPQVIDYCLQHLRVAWSRVEMPWRFWQPDLSKDPIEEAKAGRLNPRVKAAMEMAQRLNKMGIPVILTAWSSPAWAVVGKPKFRPGPDGIWGNPLDHTKDTEIYKSIADYIEYLKDQYGVIISDFSFNESDLGINIRQTGEEHAALIKGLGAYFVSRGLKTKLLLGDNSDATTYEFIYPAMNDPETYPYIGAVSFHSWRGWETETLQKWADAATKLKLPLLVGEGSIDAAAWNYPAIFEEPVYAMEEINLYIRLLAICQPESILQWQLTADYSPLAGGGIFGNNEPLHPTQRFWNLKQLASTPAGLKAMTLQGDHDFISCAALGDNRKGIYALHLVNNGTTRKVALSGIPSGVKSFRIYITGTSQAMKEGKRIQVKNGRASFTLDSYAYTTLISG
jgi:hypothetical protein